MMMPQRRLLTGVLGGSILASVAHNVVASLQDSFLESGGRLLAGRRGSKDIHGGAAHVGAGDARVVVAAQDIERRLSLLLFCVHFSDRSRDGVTTLLACTCIIFYYLSRSQT